MNLKELYNKDFQDWLKTNISLLKEGKFDEIDLKNIIVQLEGLNPDRIWEAEAALIRVFIELFRWEINPLERSEVKKIDFEREINLLKDILEYNPSIKEYLEEELSEIFERSINRYLMRYSFIPCIHSNASLPENLKYKLDEILNLKLEVREDFKVFGA